MSGVEQKKKEQDYWCHQKYVPNDLDNFVFGDEEKNVWILYYKNFLTNVYPLNS